MLQYFNLLDSAFIEHMDWFLDCQQFPDLKDFNSLDYFYYADFSCNHFIREIFLNLFFTHSIF